MDYFYETEGILVCLIEFRIPILVEYNKEIMKTLGKNKEKLKTRKLLWSYNPP